MHIPETDNIHYQYAFKKGYRMAIDGKSVSNMPSQFRRDMELRKYFQLGWEQAVEDVTMAQEDMSKPNWRYRFIWFAVMVIGGLATAAHIINLYETERAEQQALIEAQLNAANRNAPNLPINTENLALLNAEQRNDLKLNQAAAPAELPSELPLEEIVQSQVRINKAVLAQSIENREPVNLLTTQVPKFIREVYFFTEIEDANDQKITHRWRTHNQILATIELDITSNKFRTWSSKKMASAWVGQWYVEVLNENQEVIHRTAFEYTNQLNEPQ